MIQLTAESIGKQDDDALLKCLVDLAENAPKFLRSQMEPLLQMCTQAVGNQDLLDSWRQLALEVSSSFFFPTTTRRCRRWTRDDV